ncbi:MAG: hypothetical protein NC420_00585 [Eubacterium sp.]|nr:hypothetical protein [Eubacterium sp.]MCM1213756.1 hypothetical protein [Lachnospiraceae bacterium]MCM1237875.1 hypothetical protein [Lachnospiraceae bacterium]
MTSTSDKVTVKIQILVSILGESFFYRILDFFVDIMQSSEQIKILMTRRLSALYSVFKEIIDFLYEGDIKPQGRIVTNISVVLWESMLNNADILLVDDIVLHGRALDEEYKYLVEHCGCSPDRIRAKVLLQNIDKKLIKSGLLDRLDASEKVDDEIWRTFSGKIVNAFFTAGQPYISYLPYAEYDLDTPEGECLKKFVQDKEQVEDITTTVQEHYGVGAFLYCTDHKALEGTLKITQADLIRVYTLKRLGKVIVVPYCYLKPVKKGSLRGAFQKIKSQHYIDLEGGREEIEDCWQQEDVYAHNRFMYSTITYLISMALGNVFLKNIGIKHAKWKEEIPSLGFKSAECLRGREKELTSCLKEFESGFIMEDKKDPFTKVSKDIYDKVRSAQDSVSQFIRECGKQDEQRADKNEPRMKGISIGTLCDMFKIDAMKTIWCKAISLADAGKVTIIVSPDVIDRQECVGNLLAAGEQNPTCNEENRAALVLPLIEFKGFCTINGYDFATLKDGLIEQLCSRCPEIKNNLLPDEYEEVVNNEVLNYRDYYIDRLPIYANNSILKKALNIEVQYEKSV